MREYARQRGLWRWTIPVPLLTPRLSSLWLGLVTPLYARVGRKLVDSLRHPTVVRNDSARRIFSIQPIGVKEAIARALRNEDSSFALTRWSDAVSAATDAPRLWGGTRLGNRLVDSRSTQVTASPAKVFRAVERIGGGTGWYYATWLWTLRGWLDLLMGGVGMRRGRRDPDRLRVGDPAEVAEKILAIHRIFGNRRLLMQMSVGTMPHAEVVRSKQSPLRSRNRRRPDTAGSAREMTRVERTTGPDS